MADTNKARATYAPEEKAEIVLAVMNRKVTIQKIAKEKGVAATLVSLWKKQAEDAVLERFTGTRPGRRKVDVAPEDMKEELRKARIEARTAKTRATRLEQALKKNREKVAVLERGVRGLVESMGGKVVKSTRRQKKA